MPDTAENQARYPQPRSQAAGVGFPLAGLVGIVCLSTGAVLEAAIGAHASKGQSEQDLFRGLLGTLRPGDVLLADALYCSYFLIATLQAAGVDVLFEQHGSRHYRFSPRSGLGQARSCGVLAQATDATGMDEPRAVSRLPRAADRAGGESRWPSARDHDAQCARGAQKRTGQRSTLAAGTWSSTFATSKPPWGWKCCAA